MFWIIIVLVIGIGSIIAYNKTNQEWFICVFMGACLLFILMILITVTTAVSNKEIVIKYNSNPCGYTYYRGEIAVHRELHDNLIYGHLYSEDVAYLPDVVCKDGKVIMSTKWDGR